MSVRDDIEQAMQRLLGGTSAYTDGRLTKTNLATEAGVGRATLYRHPDMIAEWNRRVAQADGPESRPSTGVTIARLVGQLNEERRRRRESDRVASGLAIVVAELYRALEDNRCGDSVVVPILPTRRRGICDE